MMFKQLYETQTARFVKYKNNIGFLTVFDIFHSLKLLILSENILSFYFKFLITTNTYPFCFL